MVPGVLKALLWMHFEEWMFNLKMFIMKALFIKELVLTGNTTLPNLIYCLRVLL